MGNKLLKRKKKSLCAIRKINKAKSHKRKLKNKKAARTPSSLVALCEKVIIKFRLLPEAKRFTAPESFSVVGGKPLRKRPEKTSSELLKVEKQRKKGYTPKSLATLCQIVIDKYNILPKCEETSLQSTSQLLIKKRKRGRPKKTIIKEKEPKLRRGRPRKDAAKEDTEDSATKTVKYTTFLRESHNLRLFQVEEDLKSPVETDPLQNDEDYTVVIKEECVDDEDLELGQEVPTVEVPRATRQGIVINPAASMEIPGPSGRTLEPMAKYMTVVMDEYQIFANSIAEQLRTLPPCKALLLQLDIQTMIDNEKQLLQDEN